MTQQERQEKSREAICKAALEEFGTYGYENVNMEQICSRHDISKGMMYHYYSNKDELFLICAERTFTSLASYVSKEAEKIQDKDPMDAIKDYMMLRECFFRSHPLEERVFKSALFSMPEHLADQIRQLRAPLKKQNMDFIAHQVRRLPLREGLTWECVSRYLESIDYIFRDMLSGYIGDRDKSDLHSVFEFAEELLSMALFGIVRQPGSEERQHSF